MQDLYEILKITHDADPGAIKRAYHKLALSAHPDKQGGHDLMTQLNDAYGILSDQQKRAEFDQQWAQHQALNETQTETIISAVLTSNTERFSIKFMMQHQQLINQYKNQPLSVYQKTSFVSNETWGGFAKSIIDHPHFPVKLDEKSIEKSIKAVFYFLNVPISQRQIDKIKQNLDILASKLAENHRQKLLLQAIQKIFVNQFDLSIVTCLGDFARESNGELQTNFARLFASKGWRAKVMLAYEQAMRPHNLTPTLIKSSLIKQYEALAGDELADTWVTIYRRQLMTVIDDQATRVKLQEGLSFFNLCQLYEHHTQLSHRTSTQSFREFAFIHLDWLAAYSGKITRAGLVNFYFKSALLFLISAVDTTKSIEKMADEHLAWQLLLQSYQLAREVHPGMEIYVLGNLLPVVPFFSYEQPGFLTIIQQLQQRLNYLVDIFPFHFTLKSNMELMLKELEALSLCSAQLLYLLPIYNTNIANISTADTLNLAFEKVLYFAYEAALRGWLITPEPSYQVTPLRLRLMQALFDKQGWHFNHMQRHLVMPYLLVQRDKQHWLNPIGELPRPKQQFSKAYQAISAIRLDRQTGELLFNLQAWKQDQPAYLRLFTLFEVYQTMSLNAGLPFFSLDPVDGDMSFHPFNKMRFSPENSLHSALMQTMFMTDYILKFLTTGAEVQGQYPYEIRAIDSIKKQLPARLKQIIDEFHQSQHDESVHRFWIEPINTAVAYRIEQSNDKVSDQIGLSKLQMVIKTHKMRRNFSGELVDSSDEHEGWHIYKLSPKQFTTYEAKKNMLAYPAIIFYETTNQIYYLENEQEKIIANYAINSHTIHQLLHSTYDEQGKLMLSDSNRLVRYQAIRKMTELMNLPHYFSPEYIFAQELSQHYDALGQIFPEFLRLKALTQLVILIRLLNNVYHNITNELTNAEEFLNNHELWHNQLSAQRRHLEQQRPNKSVVYADHLKQLTAIANTWRQKLNYSSLLAKQKLKLSNIYQEIQNKKPNADTEIQRIYDKMLAENRQRISTQFGDGAWYQHQATIEQELMTHSKNIVHEAIANYLPNTKQQLISAYDTVLSDPYNLVLLIDKLVDRGQYDELAKLLTDNEIEQNINNLTVQSNLPLSHNDFISIIKQRSDKPLQQVAEYLTDETFVKVNNQIEQLYDKAKTDVEQQKQKIRQRIRQRQKSLKNLKKLGITGELTSHQYAGSDCIWVPASIYSPSQQRLVYGGVNLITDINLIDGDTVQGREIIDTAWRIPDSESVRVDNDSTRIIYHDGTQDNIWEGIPGDYYEVVTDGQAGRGSSSGMAGDGTGDRTTVGGVASSGDVGKTEKSTSSSGGSGTRRSVWRRLFGGSTSTSTSKKVKARASSPPISMFHDTVVGEEKTGYDSYDRYKINTEIDAFYINRELFGDDTGDTSSDEGGDFVLAQEGESKLTKESLHNQSITKEDELQLPSKNNTIKLKEEQESDTSSVVSDEGGGSKQFRLDTATQVIELIDLNHQKQFADAFFTSSENSHNLLPGFADSTLSSDEQQYINSLRNYIQQSTKTWHKGFAYSFVKTSLWLIAHDPEWFKEFVSIERSAIERILNAVLHKAKTKQGFPSIRIGDYLKLLLQATDQAGSLAILSQYFGYNSQSFFAQDDRSGSGGGSMRLPSCTKIQTDWLYTQTRQALAQYRSKSYNMSSLSERTLKKLIRHLSGNANPLDEFIYIISNFVVQKNSNGGKPSLLHDCIFQSWLQGLQIMANQPKVLAVFLTQHQELLDCAIYSPQEQGSHPWSRMTVGDYLMQSIDPSNQASQNLLAFYGITRRTVLLDELFYHLEQQKGLQERIRKIDNYLSQSESERQANPLKKRSQGQREQSSYDKLTSTQARSQNIRQQGYQDHHVIPYELKDHPLFALAGFDINSRANRLFLPEPTEANQSRASAIHMSAEERAKLPPNERRTLHRGRHDAAVTDGMWRRMNRIVDQGKLNGWRKEQYSQELVKLITEYREPLKQGVTTLNKHVRPWAETNTKMGVK